MASFTSLPPALRALLLACLLAALFATPAAAGPAGMAHTVASADALATLARADAVTLAPRAGLPLEARTGALPEPDILTMMVMGLVLVGARASRVLNREKFALEPDPPPDA